LKVDIDIIGAFYVKLVQKLSETCITKKKKTFFLTLGALSSKGVFYFGAFCLESALWQNSISIYLLQQNIPINLRDLKGCLTWESMKLKE
jgi:hypothetical protein